MSQGLRLALGVSAAFLTITCLHVWLNIGFDKLGQAHADHAPATHQVGYLPVTCHLTCPVTDWLNKNQHGEGLYEPVRFSGFPEIKEALIAGHISATFMLAPMAMALREQGVPVKIVYLGHRDGTALMVHKDSRIYSFADLRGKTIAIPNRFSNQFLIIFKGLSDHGLSLKDVNLVEMPPPDMPAALYSKSVDAIISGEPWMAKSEMEGYGRVLYQAKDIWPNFISCVLVVREEMIKAQPAWVQTMVDGIASSGQWLDADMAHRMSASEVVARDYYHQDPKLLRYVLSNPPDRVTYTNLRLLQADFEQIERLAYAAGLLRRHVAFAEYADVSFSNKTAATRFGA